ncbi:NmrA family NAD(P)-binding protein [Nonomuraea gerenzanensis]|uniref:Oxidoreductase n=1 Tax=Nonomuraea gerenzanensis TaxID=93944 RepID=A0A1M4EA00_9ACTN|nr:NmrA family NAD(P)-binding protein [Nonomuraea gerenzanensis]UBU17957.1 NmrA family NAD(P)-binding protein [Nonomuraea gerenzanensis]SBO95757.1 Oxidoreductase [Nonomuraea gerenzanensis]
MEPTSVLVVGAGGAIGTALVDRLVPDHQAGRIRLVATARRPESARRLRERGIEVRHLDLDEAETGGLGAVLPVFDGAERVFLLTGYDVRMLAQSKAAVDAARAAGAAHVVHVGVNAAPDTTIVHFAWHQLVEAYLERSGLGHTHLRPSAFMQTLGLGVAEPGVLRHWVGDGRPSWVDVADIAAVAAAVLRDPAAHAGQAYELAAESASLHEVAALLGEVTGRPWRYEPAEPEEFYRRMTAAGGDPVYLACVRNVFERTRNGTLTDPPVTGHIEQVTGRPATTLRAFVQRHRELFDTGEALSRAR